MFKLLIVEDDKDINRTVCVYLNQNGYVTKECISAEEAYDAIYGRTVFDLIISDIMMPGEDRKQQKAGNRSALDGCRRAYRLSGRGAALRVSGGI